MATDLYTPVVTGGGYRIIPETGTNVGNTSTFSPAETYKFSSDGYYNQGDTVLGDAYKALREGSNAYSNTANQINDFYSQLGQDVYRREMALAGQKEALANKLAQDMGQTRQYALDMFGPDGVLTREVNRYYDDLGNYLATDAGRQAAIIAAQGMHSGASLGAIRAQQNQAYNEGFARYVQAKEQEINAKQQIASNLINYMSTLRQEYGDTTNQYVIQQYQRANDLLNSLSQSIANNNIQLAQARLASSGNGNSPSYSYDIYGNLINSNGEIVMTKDEIAKMSGENTNRTVGRRFPILRRTNSNSTEGASYVIG